VLRVAGSRSRASRTADSAVAVGSINVNKAKAPAATLGNIFMVQLETTARAGKDKQKTGRHRAVLLAG
jgi:hypothetical protein